MATTSALCRPCPGSQGVQLAPPRVTLLVGCGHLGLSPAPGRLGTSPVPPQALYIPGLQKWACELLSLLPPRVTERH